MTNLTKNSQTHRNLKIAFERECQTSIRYTWFAQQADVMGNPDVAARFRSLADGAALQAHGHLANLAQFGDPLSEEPIGGVAENLKASIAGGTYEHTHMYPEFAKDAKHDNAQDIAAWFESCSNAKKSHSTLLTDCLSQAQF